LSLKDFERLQPYFKNKLELNSKTVEIGWCK